MVVTHLHVAGYRSIRDLDLRLSKVNVLVGANGCGKSNLYRALHLLAEAAQGRLALAFAEEGGFPSALWAGKPGLDPVRMTVAATIDGAEYAMTCGLPTPDKYQIDPSRAGRYALDTAFGRDPEIKEERIVMASSGRKIEFLTRHGRRAVVVDQEGQRTDYPVELDRRESALAQLLEPHRYPELGALRAELTTWRFYHGFRTDAHSPIRAPQVGVFTPILQHDGRDCAAALQTIIEHGNHDRVQELIRRAIPGARLKLDIDRERAVFEIQLGMRGMTRKLRARELSDGTLRYLCLVAALLSPRPASLLALNEPETSLHPDLILPLAELVADAARRSQLWVTTHSRALADAIAAHGDAAPIELQLVNGETRAADHSRLGVRRD